MGLGAPSVKIARFGNDARIAWMAARGGKLIDQIARANRFRSFAAASLIQRYRRIAQAIPAR